MVKISQLPQQPTATLTDKVPVVSNGVTDYETLQDLITLFFNNIPASAATSTTLAQDTQLDFIKSGTGIWTADNVGVNRNASMNALTCYQNGQKLTVAAVTSRTFTASKDTYIDILNTAGVATLIYTEVTNNAASPALAASSIRLAIVITGATTIATTGSINQGQDEKLLPIASSIPYTICDSLGNRICCRNSTETRRGLGTKTSIGDVIPNAYTTYQTIRAIVYGRSTEIEYGASIQDGASGAPRSGHIRVQLDGVTLTGTDMVWETATNNITATPLLIFGHTPTAGLHTWTLQVEADTAAASLVNQAYIRVVEP